MCVQPTEFIIKKRYRVIKNLVNGGFGITYLAEDTQQNNLMCVVKQLRPEKINQNTIERFKREAAALQNLKHKQIPTLYDYFEENNNFYIVQEYIEGNPLNQIFKEGQCWSEQEAIRLLYSILKPLAFVHQTGIIHRDIKPDNLIKRNNDQEIVIIDFGGVKEEATGKSTVMYGTRGYMSVEQMSGNPQLNSDLYGVGIVILNALTGTISGGDIQKEHDGTVILNKTNEQGEIIYNKVTVSQDFQKIINKLVAGEPRNRFESAVEALEAVKKLLKIYLTSQTTGINYEKLDELLKNQLWKEADEMTYQLMLEVTKKVKKINVNLKPRDLKSFLPQFPTEDLKIIDQLWLDHSQGKFGFSVQKNLYIEIYQKLKGQYPLGNVDQWYDSKTWNEFCLSNGWKRGKKEFIYREFNFSIDAPQAHLPGFFNNYFINGKDILLFFWFFENHEL
jgi:serine/threonine protein kinase